ncbi:MAG TPA: cyclic nucleotide-binding domain-containing protein [Candidatus Obscuribacterales bacterium]
MATSLSESQEELVAFLKERSIFRVLDERVLKGIAQLFEELSCGPGHIVFKQGDDADAIYVIREGSVEVIQDHQGSPRVIAYLTSGDCFGEMALMHDTARNATIRVPEEARILRLSRKAFTELQAYFPEITREVTKVVNRRLSGKLPFSSPGLQGNLAFFDLPTVVQTVVGSRQTGVLSLRGRAGKLLAQLFIRQGRLVHASYMHLTGELAFYELLTRTDPLDFQFEQQGDLDPAVPIDKPLSAKEPYKLLMEGARRADELPKLMSSLDWPSQIYVQAGPQPDWTSLKVDVEPVARKLWFLLEAGLTVQQLAEKLPYDRYTLLSVIDELQRCGHVRARGAKVSVPKPVEHKPSEVAAIVSAINAISLNLATIMGAARVRAVLGQALEQSSRRYSNLTSLKLNSETVTLDVRLAKPDMSQSEASIESLEHLARTFLKLASELPQPDPTRSAS